MKLLPYIFIPLLLLGCAQSRQVGMAEPIIDTTSWATIIKSIEAANPDDRQIVGAIPCDLGHKLGLNPSDTKQRELLLEQLRVQFCGKSVAQVAAEVRTQQKSESYRLQKFSEDYVRERQERWKSRAEHVSSVTIGTREEDVLKYFGSPESDSHSDTARFLFYWISAYMKDGQICEDFIEFKIERGVVVSLRQARGYAENIADAYKKTHK